MDSKQFLGSILDHFVANGETPGDEWAFDDDMKSFGLDHISGDGAKLWIDLDRDGTVTLMWKPAGTTVPHILKFIHA